MTDPDDFAMSWLSHPTSRLDTISTTSTIVSSKNRASNTVSTVSSAANIAAPPTSISRIFGVSVSTIAGDPAACKNESVRFLAVVSNLIKNPAGIPVAMDVRGLTHPSSEVIVEVPPDVTSRSLRPGDKVDITGSGVTASKDGSAMGVEGNEASLTAKSIVDLTSGYGAIPNV